MVGLIASHAIDRGFKPQSGQTKDYNIDIYCFSSLACNTLVSCSNKTDHHDITEILLKVALSTLVNFIQLILQLFFIVILCMYFLVSTVFYCYFMHV